MWHKWWYNNFNMSDDINTVKVEIDLTKPVTILIEKISNGVGILYEPSRIKRKAIAEGEAKIILAEAQIKASSIEKRAIERLVKEEVKKQENIESVISRALPDVSTTATPENIEDDWLFNFFDKSKIVSDKEMQDAWARLLASEANSPGTFSKRTINLLSELDKKDAMLFTRLAQFTVLIYNGHIIPFVDKIQDEMYSKNGINFESVQHLDSLGLIKFNSVSGFKLEQRGEKGGQFLIEYNEYKFWVKIADDKNTELSVGHLMYTQQGLELLKICSPKNNKDFLEYLRLNIAQKGATIVDVPKNN